MIRHIFIKIQRCRTYCFIYCSMVFSVCAFAQTDTPVKIQTQRPVSLKMNVNPFLAGDALRLRVYPDTNSFVNGVYPIDGNGFANFPILGLVKLVDLGADSLASLLLETYLKYLRYPNLQVDPLMRVAFVGGFYKPGLYYVDPKNTLFQSMTLTGGTIREDGIQKLRLERDKSVVKANLVADFQSGKSLLELGYKSGDQICVMQRPLETRWDVVRNNVIPVLSVALSAISTAATVYLTYESYRAIHVVR